MPPKPMPEFDEPNKKLLVHVMKSCWKKEPKERPTFAQIEEELQLMYDHS